MSWVYWGLAGPRYSGTRMGISGIRGHLGLLGGRVDGAMMGHQRV